MAHVVYTAFIMTAALWHTSFGHMQKDTMKFTETQLTRAAQGHTLNNRQVFSKDGNWLVYDTRNDDTQIGSTRTIACVHVKTGEVKVLYTTANASAYGPGVGAVTFSPTANRVLFIQGIRNADQSKPYSTTRRTGVAVDTDHPQQPHYLDARDISAPFTAGALRGGTHAHSWSGNGQRISFTYNDYVMEQLSKTGAPVQDLRMVGVMVPGAVQVAPDPSAENNSGEMFAMVVTRVTEHPQPGSDEISKAFDECWIGEKGYQKKDGTHQPYAIAFQGDVRDKAGHLITEVFVTDLPDQFKAAHKTPLLAGTPTTRPAVPEGVVQRRVTHTPQGITGPRHWLRTTPDGSLIFFLAKDDSGLIQLFCVSPNGGAVKQVTHHAFSVQGQFNLSPDGNLIAYPADNSLFVTDRRTGASTRITPKFSDADGPLGAPNWSPDGNTLAYNRYVDSPQGRFLQIFLLRKDRL